MSIKKGDLVMVKSMQCCGSCSGIEGTVFTVTGIQQNDFLQRCNYCGQSGIFPGALGHPCGQPVDIDRLKKLDPPSEGETREAYVNIDVNLKQPHKVTA